MKKIITLVVVLVATICQAQELRTISSFTGTSSAAPAFISEYNGYLYLMGAISGSDIEWTKYKLPSGPFEKLTSVHSDDNSSVIARNFKRIGNNIFYSCKKDTYLQFGRFDLTTETVQYYADASNSLDAGRFTEGPDGCVYFIGCGTPATLYKWDPSTKAVTKAINYNYPISSSGIEPLAMVDNYIVYPGDLSTGSTNELVKINISTGEVTGYEINPGTYTSGTTTSERTATVKPWIVYNNKVYFSAITNVSGSTTEIGQRQLFVIDPLTSNPPVRLTSFNNTTSGDADVSQLFAFNNKIYFQVRFSNGKHELYVLNTATNEVSAVTNFNWGASIPIPRFALGDYVYFTASVTGATDKELLRVNTNTNAYEIIGACTMNTSLVIPPVLINNIFWLNGSIGISGNEILKFDPAANKISLAVDVYSGTTGSNPAYLTCSENKLYFIALPSGTERQLMSYFDSEAMPVELSSFSSQLVNGRVLLKWTTVSEIENYGFEVQKSSDGINWSVIGFVQGNGNSNVKRDYTFSDPALGKELKSYYRLKQIDADGDYKYSDITECINTSPAGFSLNQNYPNPFNPVTLITYSLKGRSKVKLIVYDITGREISELVNSVKEAGSYQIVFSGENLPSGLYFCRIQADGYEKTIKMSLLK